MSFKKVKQFGDSMLLEHVIDNSDTVVVGELVKLRNGNLEVVTAGDAIHGVVVDFVDKKGNSVFGSIASVGSATVTGNAPTPGVGQVAVASDNETVDLIAARVETSKTVFYSADVDGTISTTNNSDSAGGWLDATDENSVNETTHTRTITTGGQLKNWGRDPDDSTRLLVSINESECWDAGDPMTA